MKLVRRGEHTEGVSETCEYRTGEPLCGEPSAGELRAHSAPGHRLPWGMCAGHVKPEHHPADVHDQLYCW